MIHALLDESIRDLMTTRDDQLNRADIDAGLAKKPHIYYERAAELCNGDTEYKSMVLLSSDMKNPMVSIRSQLWKIFARKWV